MVVGCYTSVMRDAYIGVMERATQLFRLTRLLYSICRVFRMCQRLRGIRARSAGLEQLYYLFRREIFSEKIQRLLLVLPGKAANECYEEEYLRIAAILFVIGYYWPRVLDDFRQYEQQCSAADKIFLE